MSRPTSLSRETSIYLLDLSSSVTTSAFSEHTDTVNAPSLMLQNYLEDTSIILLITLHYDYLYVSFHQETQRALDATTVFPLVIKCHALC